MSERRATIPEAVASRIDYTALRKDMSYRELEMVCLEAVTYNLRTIIVPSGQVRRACAFVSGSRPAIGTVISHPFGTQAPAVKAVEAATAVAAGAQELDVIPHFGTILAERWEDYAFELRTLGEAAGDATLKLVLEATRFSQDILAKACSIAAELGFSYVVNTVGFRLVSTDPSAQGQASPETLSKLAAGSNGLKLKAAGGIITLAGIRGLLSLGVNRVCVDAALGVLRTLAEEGAK